MIKRGLALALVLGMASVAQAGAVLELVATPPGSPSPNAVVTVEIFLKQVPAGDDHLLRLVQLDFSWDAALGLSPVTWSVGLNHYEETDIAGGRPNLVAFAHHGDTTTPFLGPDSAVQLTLPGDGSTVKIGELDVTMPGVVGDYDLDVVGSSSSVIFGFGCDSGSPCDPGDEPDALVPVTVWIPTGSAFTFEVRDVVEAGTWESVGTHGLGVGDVGLEISAAGTSSEPRFSGLSKLVVTFSGAIDPATAGPGAVAVVGNDCANNPVDLSGLTIGTTTTDGDTKLEITLTPKLPDCARYRATLTGIQSAGGTPIAGVTELFMTGLVGDASGDLRVAANDVVGVRSFVGVEPIDPTEVFHVRCDASGDGRIKANDVVGVRSFVGNNASFIPDP